MRKIIFERSGFQDFVEWATIDKKLYQRIVDLIMDILRQPFSGIGKPEPLKHDLKGYGNNDHKSLTNQCSGRQKTPPLIFVVSHGETAFTNTQRRQQYEATSVHRIVS